MSEKRVSKIDVVDASLLLRRVNVHLDNAVVNSCPDFFLCRARTAVKDETSVRDKLVAAFPKIANTAARANHQASQSCLVLPKQLGLQ